MSPFQSTPDAPVNLTNWRQRIDGTHALSSARILAIQVYFLVSWIRQLLDYHQSSNHLIPMEIEIKAIASVSRKYFPSRWWSSPVGRLVVIAHSYQLDFCWIPTFLPTPPIRISDKSHSMSFQQDMITCFWGLAESKWRRVCLRVHSISRAATCAPCPAGALESMSLWALGLLGIQDSLGVRAFS